MGADQICNRFSRTDFKGLSKSKLRVSKTIKRSLQIGKRHLKFNNLRVISRRHAMVIWLMVPQKFCCIAWHQFQPLSAQVLVSQQAY